LNFNYVFVGADIVFILPPDVQCLTTDDFELPLITNRYRWLPIICSSLTALIRAVRYLASHTLSSVPHQLSGFVCLSYCGVDFSSGYQPPKIIYGRIFVTEEHKSL